MNHRTDTELKDAWKKLQARRPMAGPEQKREIERDELLIRIEWKEIVARKRRGENTDEKAVTDVEATIAMRAKLAGIPIRVARASLGQRENYDPLPWIVFGIYDGPIEDYDEARFDKLRRAILDELIAADVPLEGDHKDMSLITETATRRRGIAFVVPAWTWHGPDAL